MNEITVCGLFLTAGICFATFIVIYALYAQGLISVECRRCLFSVGGFYNMRFKNCSGSVRRVVKFKESAEREIRLCAEIDKGEVYAVLKDARGGFIARIGDEPFAFKPQAGEKYGLIIYFKKASGKYDLTIPLRYERAAKF